MPIWVRGKGAGTGCPRSPTHRGLEGVLGPPSLGQPPCPSGLTHRRDSPKPEPAASLEDHRGPQRGGPDTWPRLRVRRPGPPPHPQAWALATLLSGLHTGPSQVLAAPASSQAAQTTSHSLALRGPRADLSCRCWRPSSRGPLPPCSGRQRKYRTPRECQVQINRWTLV